VSELRRFQNSRCNDKTYKDKSSYNHISGTCWFLNLTEGIYSKLCIIFLYCFYLQLALYICSSCSQLKNCWSLLFIPAKCTQLCPFSWNKKKRLTASLHGVESFKKKLLNTWMIWKFFR